MRSYRIRLPRGLEVDIFNLPENFGEEINRVFGEYTQETSEDYRDCDRLGFIDCCVRHIKPNKIVHCEERGYSGFLHIRCKCGAEKSFFTKAGLSFYKCAECGDRTELKDLKLALLICECGERLRYFTNETAEMFDLNCLDCGQPVAMKYNVKKKRYETIRE